MCKNLNSLVKVLRKLKEEEEGIEDLSYLILPKLISEKSGFFNRLIFSSYAGGIQAPRIKGQMFSGIIFQRRAG